ncbi:hypothetical protein [Natranaeroarchaeum aerophilus]|uniref:Uncharacterized protein n=1 Tax=Natranaeroarchaeum aerophilus TaxID=2917711 RepID=A0AAE3K460_9EURY|nr:hypothetical protein [Natranaeroarchaeum aerophilus]MCL9812876.1 hypothetical protein [Natranaeroarchaeum aerophilus]
MSSEDGTANAMNADPERLREDLDQIKEAMGIQERYPAAFQLWLLYATLGVFASLGSQAVITFELSPWGHWLSWGGFYVIGAVYARVRLDSYDRTTSERRPSIRMQGAGIVGLLLAVFVAIAPLQGDQTTVFGLIVIAVGAFYIVQAASLRAYPIRDRDRYAFYVGGVWMLAYGAAMPNIGVLQEWGYAGFGILFAIHGIASYVFLAR